MELKCKGCGKKPEDIEEYVEMGKMENMTPEDFVLEEEGTLNRETGLFYCTDCYVKAGMPLGTA